MNRVHSAIVGISIGIVTLLSGAVLNNVYAHDYDSNHDLAHRLAVRFHLNEKEVEEFLNDRKEIAEKPAQDKDHLAFIEGKLEKGVKDGWINTNQKKAVVSKLKEMMKSTPSSQEFSRLDKSEQQSAINEWKRSMSKWAIKQNLTLDMIRNLTGKGNKYLMGIELE